MFYRLSEPGGSGGLCCCIFMEPDGKATAECSASGNLTDVVSRKYDNFAEKGSAAIYNSGRRQGFPNETLDTLTCPLPAEKLPHIFLLL